MNEASKGLDAEQLLRIVLDAIPIRVFWKDKQSHFLGANQLLLNDLGLEDLDNLIGKSDHDFFKNPKEIEAFRLDDLTVMESNNAKIGIEEALKVEGKETRWLKTNKVPMTSISGDVIGVLGTYEDITEQVQYRQLIETQALIDPLTGIANRRQLQNTLVNNKSNCAGLIFIDLDHFKRVNDSLGHAVGDLLLQCVAARFETIMDCENALLARLGGDEFSIFIPFKNNESARKKLEVLAQNLIDCLVSPFEIENNVITLGASIGITILDKGNQHHSSRFREADMAMYSAKDLGRNNFQFYTASMKDEAQRKHRLQSCLLVAIERNEFSLVYQVQVDSDDKLIGAEALLRWNSEELGLVGPDEFIPLAEESGLIHAIGEWVLDTALSTLSSWTHITDVNPNFKLAVNFSSRQFQNKKLPTLVEKLLKKNHVSPQYLQVEITESLFIDHKELAVKSMLKMQKIGISIAIDDFGTGYSSLSYLAILPIDKLKIDRSFVTDLHLKSTNKKLVGTLINMSKNLQMEVIAEGVETEQEKQALMELDCFQYQGYLFGKPMDEKSFRLKY